MGSSAMRIVDEWVELVRWEGWRSFDGEISQRVERLLDRIATLAVCPQIHASPWILHRSR